MAEKYECPECGAKLPLRDDSGPERIYVCGDCNAEFMIKAFPLAKPVKEELPEGPWDTKQDTKKAKGWIDICDKHGVTFIHVCHGDVGFIADMVLRLPDLLEKEKMWEEVIDYFSQGLECVFFPWVGTQGNERPSEKA